MIILRTFTIPGELIDLNTYTNCNRTHYRKGANVKKEMTEICYYACHGLVPLHDEDYPIGVTINWYCKNKRKDPDNCSFSKKFILDGLQERGIMRNDGWNEISQFHDIFHIDKENPHVDVILYKN